MNPSNQANPTYHAVLIGIDHYSDPNTLEGCVNDIDDIENLLLDSAGLGDPALRIKITRLAAPIPGSVSTTSQVNTILPTRENIVAALKQLADPATVRPNDRVLI